MDTKKPNIDFFNNYSSSLSSNCPHILRQQRHFREQLSVPIMAAHGSSEESLTLCPWLFLPHCPRGLNSSTATMREKQTASPSGDRSKGMVSEQLQSTAESVQQVFCASCLYEDSLRHKAFTSKFTRS